MKTWLRTAVAGLFGVAAAATVGFAQPQPNYPALAILSDPGFVPVALTGSGFGTPDASTSLVVQNAADTPITVPSQRSCASNPLPCIVFWEPDGIAVKLSATMTQARAKVVVGAASSEYIRAEYYSYDHVKTPVAGLVSGNPLALAIDNNPPPFDDPARRVWLNEEVHTGFKFLTPGQTSLSGLPVNHPTPGPFYRGGQSSVSLNGEDVLVDPTGRVWFDEGGDYPPPPGGGNYSRVVMYDPAALGIPRVYNIPGNDTELYGIAYQKDYVSGKDRIWYGARARQYGISTILPARIGWFEVDDATIYQNGTVAFVPTAACTGGFCADNATRNCAETTDCADTSLVCWWNEVGMSGHAGCKFVEYPLEPFGSFPHFGGPVTTYPAHIAVAADSTVWVADYWGQSSLIHLTSPTGTIVRYPLGDDPARGGTSDLGSAPWELDIAADGDVIVNKYGDCSVSRLDVSQLGPPGACETLVGGVNPCVTTLNVPGPDQTPLPPSPPSGCTAGQYCTQHTIRLDQHERTWLGTAGSWRDPATRATVGWVTRRWNGMVLFPPLSLFPLDSGEQVNNNCPADPCFPGMPPAVSLAGVAVDRSNGDVWFADYCHFRLSRLQPKTTNLALTSTATQSSTASGGGADLAVDGDIDGDFTHGSIAQTLADNQDWWQVDLGASYPVQEIELWNRTDCCDTQLQNFYVFASDVPFTSNDPAVIATQQHVFVVHQVAPAGRRFSAAVNRTARYVRVQLAGTGPLQLAEVVVLGGRCTTAASCDDGNGCSNDACAATGGCTHDCRTGQQCANGCAATCQMVAGACWCVAQ
jgi:streptogramin lyase